MRRSLLVLALFCLNASGILLAQKGGADPTQRYFRLICLVHLTGSGSAGDPVVPEYVVQGTAAAQAGIASNTAATATASASATINTAAPGAPVPVTPKPVAPPSGALVVPVAAPPGPMSSRPGILAWSMQVTDDGTMAIIHVVAADRNAFQAILADTRPEIRVFEIGKDTPAAINAALQQYKQSFDLDSFKVVVQ